MANTFAQAVTIFLAVVFFCLGVVLVLRRVSESVSRYLGGNPDLIFWGSWLLWALMTIGILLGEIQC